MIYFVYVSGDDNAISGSKTGPDFDTLRVANSGCSGIITCCICEAMSGLK